MVGPLADMSHDAMDSSSRFYHDIAFWWVYLVPRDTIAPRVVSTTTITTTTTEKTR